ncbi:hypothetical protein PoB_002147600 [Plakobranchus ocellatus]|uniref:Uncharacterized protein n=1 Tax=Plakobranchus ocellatus TaxID=259542 RepID=A0AAV3Z6N2_9GAST|nr:hypothetical protein PoB_002147600 [Plakobranchus ocellatus]
MEQPQREGKAKCPRLLGIADAMKLVLETDSDSNMAHVESDPVTQADLGKNPLFKRDFLEDWLLSLPTVPSLCRKQPSYERKCFIHEGRSHQNSDSMKSCEEKGFRAVG